MQYPEPDSVPEHAHWVIVRENGVYIFSGRSSALFFSGDLEKQCPKIRRVQYLGHLDTTACYAAEVSSDPAISGCTFYPGVRDLYGVLSDDELAIAALAVRIIDFDRTTRFCGQCGAPTRQSHQERAKTCDTCGLVTYPRTSPAIIVLVRKDDKVLLARSPRFPPGLHSILAGFVEPAETLEEAIHREVREETGIEVTNIRYMGSEPWPFPNSLMIGFVADYAGGDIVIDNNEIISAGWFDRDHLPALPSPMSISRSLIDWWAGDADGDRVDQ
jgi:NAD+ diphosphatase